MLRIMGYWIRYKDCVEDDKGISKFAEVCISTLSEKSEQRRSVYLQQNASLKVKIGHYKKMLEDVLQGNITTQKEFFSIKSRVRFESSIFWLMSFAEMFLNYISTLIVITDEQFLFEVMRWAISGVLTFGSIASVDLVFGLLFPVVPLKNRSLFKIIFWSLILIFTITAIASITEVRANDIGGGPFLYYGLIMLAIVLPFIAGLTRRDLMLYLDGYKNTLKKNKLENSIQELEQKVSNNTVHIDQYYNFLLKKYWRIYSNFRTYKESYNVKLQIVEDINGKYFEKYELFKLESDKRFYAKKSD